MYTLLVPSRICQTYALKALGSKVIQSKGGKGKEFNLIDFNEYINENRLSE